MNIFIPKTSVFVSSTIPENDHAEYNAGTTYSEGEKVILISEHKIYESLSDGNIGNDPATYASWWLDTGATNRWRVFDSKTHSQASAATVAAWAMVIDYVDSIALFNLRANSLKIFAGDVSTEVLSNTDDWTGATDTTPPNDWDLVGTPTNFSVVGGALKITVDGAGEGISQTFAVPEATDDMLFCIIYSNATNSVAQYKVYNDSDGSDIIEATDLKDSVNNLVLGHASFAVPATCATITLSLMAKAVGDTVSFDQPSITKLTNEEDTNLAIATVRGQGSTYLVTDWYSYFFEPVMYRAEYAHTDLYPIASSLIVVEVNSAASYATVYCGEIVVGAKKYLGITRSGPSVGIVDYSIKSPDAFGNYTVTERAYSRKLSCDLVVANTYVDELVRTLSTYRASPVVWLGDTEENYDTLIVYGFYKNFDVVLAYPGYSECSLEIEGLT